MINSGPLGAGGERRRGAQTATGPTVNRLWSRPWFFPGLGAFLYLTGMNDELLHLVGSWWLDIGRWGQTAVVLALLALVAYFTLDKLNQRRSAYRSAIRAADATRLPTPQSP